MSTVFWDQRVAWAVWGRSLSCKSVMPFVSSPRLQSALLRNLISARISQLAEENIRSAIFSQCCAITIAVRSLKCAQHYSDILACYHASAFPSDQPCHLQTRLVLTFWMNYEISPRTPIYSSTGVRCYRINTSRVRNSLNQNMRSRECKWCKSVYSNSGQWTLHLRSLAILVSGKNQILFYVLTIVQNYSW